jgi:hypothetical protein
MHIFFILVFISLGVLILKSVFLTENPYKIKYNKLKEENDTMKNELIDLRYKVAQYDEWEIDKKRSES